jgi:hypothetical protein
MAARLKRPNQANTVAIESSSTHMRGFEARAAGRSNRNPGKER